MRVILRSENDGPWEVIAVERTPGALDGFVDWEARMGAAVDYRTAER